MRKIGLSICLAALAVAASAAALTGCGNDSGSASYADGTYTGQSDVYINEDTETDEGNGYGVVTLTIENNQIVDCEFLTYEPDGTLKDEDYGKERGEIANRDFYNKAQKANAACAEYANQLIASGSLRDVDAISGATINYDAFTQAVQNALAQAQSTAQ